MELNEDLLSGQLQLGKEVIDNFIELSKSKHLEKIETKFRFFDDEPMDAWKMTIERNK